MRTENEIRLAAFRLIDQAITLKNNDNKGCPVSGDELEAIMPRIEKVREWMIANNQQHNITAYFNGKNYGLDTVKFVAVRMQHYIQGHTNTFN